MNATNAMQVAEIKRPAPMKPQVKPPLRPATADTPAPDTNIPHSGVLLFDMALNPIAADRGAAHILNHGPMLHNGIVIPDQVLNAIRRARPPDGAPPQTFSIGRDRYSYRSYEVRSEDPALPPTMIAVYIQADKNGDDRIVELAAEKHLTEREAEALRGIALGLSTKELAARMNISPNTAKAFLRLIMIKLGVTTRTAIVAKLLDKDGGG